MFEELLHSYLIQCSELTECLTAYNDTPAVFNQKAPDDEDRLWGTKTQYDRLVFYADMQADTERKISGTLEIDVHMTSTDGLERMSELVKRLVDGYFFSGENETIFVKWDSTRTVDVPIKKVTVVAVLFSLIAFPCQLTVEPDPIRVINEWTRSLIPAVKLIGYDKDLPAVWKPTAETPAVYWRNAKIYPCERIPSTYAGNWYTAQMYAHIFTIDKSAANDLAMVMCQRLNLKKVLKFNDGTWMRIDNKNQVQFGADELRIGQLSVEGDYCILREETGSPLEHIYITD